MEADPKEETKEDVAAVVVVANVEVDDSHSPTKVIPALPIVDLKASPIQLQKQEESESDEEAEDSSEEISIASDFKSKEPSDEQLDRVDRKESRENLEGNVLIRNQMLARSNSSCEESSLKPILKRQSSFCDGRSGVTCTVRDYDAKPIVKSLRRQSSMTEIETEPKIAPMLRRQNSLIDYNRRGAYDHSFNMITKIDPVYQRQHTLKHKPFHASQPLPPEPIYQTKDHVVYDPIPKPKRTYAHNCSQSSDNPYSITPDQSFENPYGSRIKPAESPYGSRCEYVAENPYGETTYSTKEQMLKQRMCSNPAAPRVLTRPELKLLNNLKVTPLPIGSQKSRSSLLTSSEVENDDGEERTEVSVSSSESSKRKKRSKKFWNFFSMFKKKPQLEQMEVAEQ